MEDKKKALALLIILLIGSVLIYFLIKGFENYNIETCGNGICEGEEQENCPEDCMECGDGFCDNLEKESCPKDCGEDCGDGICKPNEDCPKDCCGDKKCEPNENCPQDCCGDGKCTPNENCPQDCCGNGTCEPKENCPKDCCGDSICAGNENEKNCCQDCCVPACGDGRCDPNENCPKDCTPICGDRRCDPNENCPQDCGICGDGICGIDEKCPKDCCGNKKCEPNENCPQDCCGNGICEPNENCPKDCQNCGDGICSFKEKCQQDCCGDGICDTTNEDHITCQLDCIQPTGRCENKDFRERLAAIVVDCKGGCTGKTPLVDLTQNTFEDLLAHPGDKGFASYFIIFGCNVKAGSDCRGYDSFYADPQTCPPDHSRTSGGYCYNTTLYCDSRGAQNNCRKYSTVINRELEAFFEGRLYGKEVLIPKTSKYIILLGTASTTGNINGQMSSKNRELATKRAAKVKGVVDKLYPINLTKYTAQVVLDNNKFKFDKPRFKKLIDQQLIKQKLLMPWDRGFEPTGKLAINRSVFILAIDCDLTDEIDNYKKN